MSEPNQNPEKFTHPEPPETSNGGVNTPDVNQDGDDVTMPDGDEGSMVEMDMYTAQLARGASWFYWIAGMSLVNTAIIVFGGDTSFIIGLGITQIIDGIAMSPDLDLGGVGIAIAVFLDVCVAAAIVMFGIFSKKRIGAAMITGMVLYAIDGLIFLIAGDFLSLGFHAFALFHLFSGYKALRALNRLDADTAVETVDAYAGTAFEGERGSFHDRTEPEKPVKKTMSPTLKWSLVGCGGVGLLLTVGVVAFFGYIINSLKEVENVGQWEQEVGQRLEQDIPQSQRDRLHRAAVVLKERVDAETIVIRDQEELFDLLMTLKGSEPIVAAQLDQLIFLMELAAELDPPAQEPAEDTQSDE